jgi:plasmid stabilization system protein ParE
VSANRFTLKLLSIAEQDFLDIIEYLAAESPAAARTVMDQIDTRLQQLRDYPFLGKVPADTKLARMSYRVLVVKEYLFSTKCEGEPCSFTASFTERGISCRCSINSKSRTAGSPEIVVHGCTRLSLGVVHAIIQQTTGRLPGTLINHRQRLSVTLHLQDTGPTSKTATQSTLVFAPASRISSEMRRSHLSLLGLS